MKRNIIYLILFFTGAMSVVSAQTTDTSGLYNWRVLYNSTKTWEDGAFNINQTGHPDYGWGVYNNITHNLQGDSFFIIKTIDGSFKKIAIISKLSAQNIYIFKYAGLDGSNEKTDTFNCTPYTTKNFVYFNLTTGQMIDREPEKSSWDILLTRFRNTKINYNVTGFLLNYKTKACVYNANDSLTAVNSTISDTTKFTDSIAVIGNSWYLLKDMKMIAADTMVYFVKNKNGLVNKFIVIGFESGSTGQGKVLISRTTAGSTTPVNDTLIMSSQYANEVYYSFENGKIATVPRNNWDIAFAPNVKSASILTNGVAGVNLWAYPLKGLNGWDPTLIQETSNGSFNLIYPNPVKDYLRISCYYSNHPAKNLMINILDVNGKKVYSAVKNVDNGMNIIEINGLNLNSGNYVIQLINNNEISNHKFIVN